MVGRRRCAVRAGRHAESGAWRRCKSRSAGCWSSKGCDSGWSTSRTARTSERGTCNNKANSYKPSTGEVTNGCKEEAEAVLVKEEEEEEEVVVVVVGLRTTPW